MRLGKMVWAISVSDIVVRYKKTPGICASRKRNTGVDKNQYRIIILTRQEKNVVKTKYSSSFLRASYIL